MHELAVVEGILRNIETQREEHHFTRVNKIEITCGRYNCLSQENLQFCFDALAKSTPLEGARLSVKRFKIQYQCQRCGLEFNGRKNSRHCPTCRSWEIRSKDQNGIYLSKLEVSDEN